MLPGFVRAIFSSNDCSSASLRVQFTTSANHMRLAELFVSQETPLSTNQFVFVTRFEELIINPDRLYQADA